MLQKNGDNFKKQIMDKYCRRPITVNAKNYFFTNSFSSPSVLLIYVSYDFLISRFYPLFFWDTPLRGLHLRESGKWNWLYFCIRQIVSSPKTFYGSSLQNILLVLSGYLQCLAKLVLMLHRKFLIKLQAITVFFSCRRLSQQQNISKLSSKTVMFLWNEETDEGKILLERMINSSQNLLEQTS